MIRGGEHLDVNILYKVDCVFGIVLYEVMVLTGLYHCTLFILHTYSTFLPLTYLGMVFSDLLGVMATSRAGQEWGQLQGRCPRLTESAEVQVGKPRDR